ncbi:MAG: hypothetical protein ACI8V2_003863 [Candidatus Latescibacterota bacterium]|jgi:hypothetical protein
MERILGEQNLVNLSENIHRSDEVFDLVLDRLQATDFMLQKFTLTCDEKAFKKRLIAAGRPKDRIPRCLESCTYAKQQIQSELTQLKKPLLRLLRSYIT